MTKVLGLFLACLPAFCQCYTRTDVASGAITFTPCAPVVPSSANPPTITDTGLPPLPSSLALPKIPPVVTVPAFPVVTGQTIVVTQSSALQSALNAAKCGDAVEIMANIGSMTTTPIYNGHCPTGQFVLVYGAGAQLSPATARAKQLPLMPALQTASSHATFQVGNGASGLYVTQIGFTLATNPIPSGVYPIVVMCDNDCTSLSQVPDSIWFDRVQVYAPDPTSASGPFVQRGISLNCTHCGVIHSQIWGIVNAGMDAQGILADNTTGPVLVWDNDVESSGENIMTNTKMCQSGYCGSGISPGPAPSVFILGNLVSKNPAWRANWHGCVAGGAPACPTMKNLIECKMCDGWVVDHNVLQYTWAQAQAEVLIINCFAPGPYVCNNYQITNNLIQHAPSGLVINGNGSTSTGQHGLVRNNVFVDIDGAVYSTAGTQGGGNFLSFQNTVGLIVDHNTSLNKPTLNNFGVELSQPSSTNTGLVYTNNVEYGQIVSPPSYGGVTVAGFLSPTWGGNINVGDPWPNNYPSGNGSPAKIDAPPYPSGIFTAVSTAQPAGSAPCNWSAYWPSPGIAVSKSIAGCWPLDWATVGLLDFAGASAGTNIPGAALATTSPYKGKGSDATDPGANVAAVLAATQGVQ